MRAMPVGSRHGGSALQIAHVHRPPAVGQPAHIALWGSSSPGSQRAQRFAEAGADILLVEAVTTADEIRALPQRLARPQRMNMVIGGKMPIFGAEEPGQLG